VHVDGSGGREREDCCSSHNDTHHRVVKRHEMMAVSPANIAAGDFYLRFTEVREVISIAQSGDVTFLSRSKTDVVGGESGRLDTRSREQFATEVDRQVGPSYRLPKWSRRIKRSS
jgi:hypothetical protein